MIDTTTKNADEPAYPLMIKSDRCGEAWWSGLTKREKFAESAMVALLSNPAIIDVHGASTLSWVSQHAIEQADALLAELEKGQS